VSRPLPARPNLDHLKREAKRILRTLKAGEPGALPLLRSLPKYAGVTDTHVTGSATLLDVQQALARDYGFAGWPALKRYVESRTPVLYPFRPVLRVASYEEALDHYADWLGFKLEWDWREAPGQPVIAAFSRDGVEFMVNEYPDTLGPIELHLNVKNLDALADEWNARRPGSAEVRLGPPGEFPEVRITDPWGNVIAFEGKDDAAEQKRKASILPKMRAYAQAQLDAGRGFPTPEEIRSVVGPPLAGAIDVLNEFPDYGEAYDARHSDA
jgi:catechol 2,3-dioxygenase-like lactoylglutathione lyase family enzyme